MEMVNIIIQREIILIMIFKPGGLLGSKEFSVKKIFQRFGKKGGESNASTNR